MTTCNAWLARDTCGDATIYQHRPCAHGEKGMRFFNAVARKGFVVEIESQDLGLLIPDIDIAPGDGPIPVRITIERAE